jgi:hypothetical protein
MKYLQQELTESGYGDLAYWRYAYDRHGAPLLDELVAVLDHVQPFSMGGTEDTKNLATACNRCNMQKNNYDAEEWEDRHPIKPIKSKSGEPEKWDGFSNLFMHLANRYAENLTPTEKSG